MRRIYGDFSGSKLRSWAEVLSAHAIVPYQNFAMTTAKNGTDIALTIDAMDLLHSGRLDGFCIVSSDSDFTRLAARIREEGLDVFGFGEQKTPQSFRQACKRFIYTENLANLDQEAPIVPDPATPCSQPLQAGKRPVTAVIPVLRNVLKQLDDQDGWFKLGTVGSQLNARHPDFDPRTYGCAKLSTLVEKCGYFDIRRSNLVVEIQPKRQTATTQKTCTNLRPEK